VRKADEILLAREAEQVWEDIDLIGKESDRSTKERDTMLERGNEVNKGIRRWQE